MGHRVVISKPALGDLQAVAPFVARSSRGAGNSNPSNALQRADCRRRLEEIELAIVSAVRAAQMDLDCDLGVPSAAVLRKARQAIR